MTDAGRALARARAAREWLLRDLERVPEAILNEGAKPGTVTPAVTALHTAGLDLIFAAAIRPDLIDDASRSAWRVAQKGFWRELGEPMPSDLSGAEVDDAMRSSREALERAVATGTDSDRIDVGAGLAALGVEGDAADALSGVAGEHASGSPTLEDALDSLADHDQYHRGQLTLIRYLAGVGAA